MVNDIGDWMLSLALPIYVFTATRSGRDTTFVFAIEIAIGLLFGAHGGTLADRLDLKRTIVITNFLQAATLVPLLAVTPQRIWPVYVVTASQTLVAQVNNPASWSLVPRVVDDEQLLAANAANSSAGSIARLVGAPLGGIVVGLGGLGTVVLVDSLTFVTVALATMTIGADTRPLRTADSGEPDAGVRHGWRLIRGHPVLVGYLIAQSLAAVAFAMFPVLFIKFVITQLNGGAAKVGIIRSTAAFGALVASSLITRYAKRQNPASLMMWGYLSFAVVAALFINAPFVTRAIAVYLVLFALSGLPNAASQIGASAMAQHRCPAELRGRLAGFSNVGDAVGAGVGTLVVALLIDRVGIVPLFDGQAFFYLAAGITSYLLVVRRLRQDPIAEHWGD